VGAELRGFIAAGAHQEAQRLAHNLAGLAGALAAAELLEAAAAVEGALRNAEAGALPLLVDALAGALEQALTAAASLTPPGAAAAPQPQSAVAR
jgi:HPt (histidine-containing phosphotransfer) domain-containing protein